MLAWFSALAARRLDAVVVVGHGLGFGHAHGAREDLRRSCKRLLQSFSRHVTSRLSLATGRLASRRPLDFDTTSGLHDLTKPSREREVLVAARDVVRVDVVDEQSLH